MLYIPDKDKHKNTICNDLIDFSTRNACPAFVETVAVSVAVAVAVAVSLEVLQRLGSRNF